MLRILRHQPRESDQHEELFLSRYEQVVVWANQLTNQDQHEAEDLVQDAYIDFVHSRPELAPIRNLDAFLYTFVRNLHRSRLHRHLRRKDLLLSVVDYDSAETGLEGSDPGHLLEVWEDLCQVCQFACERKETSKAGSILILRFFHGYIPSEVALILRADRTVVDSRLNLARKEARLYLEDPKKLKMMRPAQPKSFRKPILRRNGDDLLRELRALIFEAKSGACLSASRLHNIYRPDSLMIPDHTVLAHIVSCQSCLDAVSELLGLPPLSGRGLPGVDSGGPPPSAGLRTKPQTTRRAAKDRIGRWQRRASAIAEHHPRELTIAVNGMPLAWQEVARDRNEFSLRVQQSERIEFIEILSEQGVRLLSLLVPEIPPEGPSEVRNEVELSDGRHLSLRLRFETLWPMVHISYCDVAESEHASRTASDAEQIDHNDGRKARKAFGFGLLFPRLFNARILTPALALLLIFAVLFYQTRETTASAATLLAKADAWEQTVAEPGLVVHRMFELDERGLGGSPLLSRRQVEVWQDRRRGKKIRKLRDDTGKVIASSTGPAVMSSLPAARVWQYEPSAENFRAIAGEVGHAKVLASGNQIEVATRTAMLTMDKATFHPTEETIFFDQHEFRFTETSFETVPTAKSPFSESETKEIRRDVAPDRARLTSAPEALPAGPTTEQLEDSEVAVRRALHDLDLDLTRTLTIRRQIDGIELAGVVESRAQRDQLSMALSAVPYVRLSVSLPEDVSPAATASALSATPSTVKPVPPLLATWLEEKYPVPADRRAYVDRVVALSHESLRRAYALEDLARRYPTLARTEIERIVDDHQKALLRNWTELRDLVAEPLGPIETSQAGMVKAWPANVQALVSAMKDFDSHLLKLFTEDASPSSASVSTNLESELNDCREAGRIIGPVIANSVLTHQ
jgi:RNA polymerase sigma factor (sigma-70 family)